MSERCQEIMETLNGVENLIMENLERGPVQSLFQFTVEHNLGYEWARYCIHNLHRLGLIDLSRANDRPGRPLVIRRVRYE